MAKGDDEGDDEIAGIASDHEAAVFRIGVGPFEPVDVAGGVERAGEAGTKPDRPGLTGDIDAVGNQWAAGMGDDGGIGQKVPNPLTSAFIKSDVEDAMSCHSRQERPADNGYAGIAPGEGEGGVGQAVLFPRREKRKLRDGVR